MPPKPPVPPPPPSLFAKLLKILLGPAEAVLPLLDLLAVDFRFVTPLPLEADLALGKVPEPLRPPRLKSPRPLDFPLDDLLPV